MAVVWLTHLQQMNKNRSTETTIERVRERERRRGTARTACQYSPYTMYETTKKEKELKKEMYNINKQQWENIRTVLLRYSVILFLFLLFFLSKCILCLSYNGSDRIKCCSIFCPLYFSVMDHQHTIHWIFTPLLHPFRMVHMTPLSWVDFSYLTLANSDQDSYVTSVQQGFVLLLLPLNSAANARFIHTRKRQHERVTHVDKFNNFIYTRISCIGSQ